MNAQRYTIGMFVIFLVMAFCGDAQAADLTWDANGATAGQTDGGGTWLNANMWWDGSTNATWNNAAPDNAVIGSGGNGGTITLETVTAGTVTLGGFNGTYTLSGGSLAQSGGITVNSGNVTIISPISGAGGISKAGSGILITRSTDNNYTGKTLVTGGILQIGNGWANSWTTQTLPSGSNLEINGGTVSVYYYGSRSLGAGAGEIQFAGGRGGLSNKQGDAGNALWKANDDFNYEVVWGALDEGAATGYFNPSIFVLNDGAASPAREVRIDNKFDLNGADRTIECSAATWGGKLTGVIRNSGATAAGIIKVGVGQLQLQGINTFNGPLTVENGSISVASINNVSTDGPLGNSALSVILGASGQTGTFRYTGGTASTTKPFTMATGGTGAFDVSTAATILTLSGVIDGAGGLTKIGTGTLTLTGTSTYTGTTTVSAGTLRVDSPGSLGASTTVSISGGVLDGTGTIYGPVNVAVGGTLSSTSLTFNAAVTGTAGAANISPAGFGTLGTITLSAGLTLNAGNAVECDLGTTSGSSDVIAITGDLTLNGTSYVAYNLPTGSAASNATYTIMTWTGSQAGTGTLVFPNGTTSMNGATLNIGASSVTITTGSSGITTGDRDVTWSGASSYVWDSSAVNWKEGVADAAYAYGDNVTFDDTGLTVSPITGNPAAPASVTVNTSSKTYTISASIGGSGGLTKSGTSTLILSGANSYSGGTVIDGGTLQVGIDGNLGDASGSITLNGGELRTGDINMARDIIIGAAGGWFYTAGNADFATTGTLTGSGTLTHTSISGSGGRTLTFSAANNDFTGTIQLLNRSATFTVNSLADSGNRIVFNNAVSATLFVLGSGTASPLVFNSRQIELASTSTVGATIKNNNATVTNTITINTDMLVSAAGNKTLTLGGSNTGDNTFAGAITNGTDAVISLTKSDGGTWILSGNNTFSGTNTVSAGTLALRGDNSLPHTGTLNRTAGSIDIEGRAQVAVLQAGGKPFPSGIYGSTSSGAQFSGANLITDDSTSIANFFTGTGVLYVGTPYPPGGTMIMVR